MKKSEILHTRKTNGERFANFLTDFFGTTAFLLANVLLFFFWIFANSSLLPNVPVFDPFPFNLLTMFVSLEAIILSVIVLVSQNKAEKIAQIRAEVDFEINVEAEREVTKILKMLDQIQRHLKIQTKVDLELKEMEKNINLSTLEKKIAEDIKKK